MSRLNCEIRHAIATWLNRAHIKPAIGHRCKNALIVPPHNKDLHICWTYVALSSRSIIDSDTCDSIGVFFLDFSEMAAAGPVLAQIHWKKLSWENGICFWIIILNYIVLWFVWVFFWNVVIVWFDRVISVWFMCANVSVVL